jgi:hypothetical protein
LYADGEKIAEQKGKRVFTFKVKLNDSTQIKAVAENCAAEAVLCYVNKPDPAYKLNRKTAGGGNWTKEEGK